MKNNILTLLFLLLSGHVFGQVTINSGDAPESFSTVQIEGVDKGLRLPRISATDMAGLEATLKLDTEAVGLVVYNETADRIEFWDGSAWIVLSSDVSIAANGINGTTAPIVELGGTMTEASTLIDQKTFDLNFTHTDSSTGEFNINNSKIKDGAVDLNATNVNVNSGAMAVSGANISMNTEKLTVVANVNSSDADVFTMDTRTTITDTFRYTHSSLEEGHLLTSDASGNAKWEGLRPFGTIVRGELDDNVPFPLSSLSNKVISKEPLLLSPGKWMIFAKCTAQSSGSTTAMYHWLSLHSALTSNATDWNFELTSGINPELSSASTVYSTPNFVHFVDILDPTYYRVAISTSNNNSDRTTSSYGGSYFYAIRIDVPTP